MNYGNNNFYNNNLYHVGFLGEKMYYNNNT